MTTGKNEPKTLVRTAEFTEGYGRDIAFSEDGMQWATATTGILHLWRENQLIKTIDVPDYINGSIRFHPDGNLLYVGAWRINITTYEATFVFPNRDILVAAIDLEDNPRADQVSITHAEWTPDGSHIVVRTTFRPTLEINGQDDYTGPDNQILLIDALTPYLIADLELETDLFPKRGLCVTDKWIATGGEDVDIWDLETGESLQNLESDDFCQFVGFNSDQTRFATTHNDGTINLWNTDNWLDVVTWQAHGELTRGVAFHPTRPILASFGNNEIIKLWSIDTSQPRQIAQIKMERDIEGLAFHPSGKQLYITSSYPAPAISIYDLDLD